MGLRTFLGLKAPYAERIRPRAKKPPRRASPLCSVCGGTSFTDSPVLWPELIEEWQISPAEAAYIDRQQGTKCTTCGTSLRGIALGAAIQRHLDAPATPLRDTSCEGLRILDLNGCGGLSTALARLPLYERFDHPEIDMHAMPFADETYDLVIHSDTLEHVADPRQALRECLRVTSPEGAVIFTIPMIVGRLSRSRDGLPKSFHGAPGYGDRDDFIVRTEFGADFWTCAFDAGAASVTITTAEFPSAQAVTLCP